MWPLHFGDGCALNVVVTWKNTCIPAKLKVCITIAWGDMQAYREKIALWLTASLARLKRPPLWAGFIAGTGVSLFLLWFLLVVLPNRNVPLIVNENTKRRADLINSNRENVLKVIQTIAGLGFIGTAYLAWKNSQLTEDKNVTDRFSKAVEMLAHEKLEMRLGGIYSLERIAKDSKEDHPVVMEVLTAFIREKTTSETYGKPYNPPEDIQSALTVIGRRNATHDQQSLNLNGCHLKGAYLREANLERADLAAANLEQAMLYGANLQGAGLYAANLQKANLRTANLKGAAIDWSNLQQALLTTTNLQGANLRKANLQKTFLMECNLQQADFKGANLKETIFFCTDLRAAQELTQDQLEGEKAPLICNSPLPTNISVEGEKDRDCHKLAQALYTWMPDQFNQEIAEEFTNKHRQKTWNEN